MRLSSKLTGIHAGSSHHMVTTPVKLWWHAIPRSIGRSNFVLGLILLFVAVTGWQATTPSSANAPEFFSEFKQCLKRAEANGADAPTRSQCHWQLETRRQELSS